MFSWKEVILSNIVSGVVSVRAQKSTKVFIFPHTFDN